MPPMWRVVAQIEYITVCIYMGGKEIDNIHMRNELHTNYEVWRSWQSGLPLLLMLTRFDGIHNNHVI